MLPPRFPGPLIALMSALAAGASLAWAAQEPSAGLKEADAVYREGIAALNRNDLKTARAKFEVAVRLAPAAQQTHSALGIVLVREGQTAAGTRELEKSLALKPDDSSTQMNLAMIYAGNGADARAIPLFAQLEAASTSSGHPLAPSTLTAYARSLAATGQAGNAARVMREAIVQEPGDAQLRDQLGSLYAQERNWPAAEDEFAAAIRLKESLATAHMHLGFVLDAENKAGASDEWVRAYSLAPQNSSIVFAVGKALAAAGKAEQAVPILEQAVKLQPRSTEASYQLAVVLQQVNRLTETITLLKRVVLAEPKNTQALTDLGLALSQAHQAKDGIPYLQRAIALQPKNATAHQDLAAAYLQVNQVDDAIGELKTAIALSPDANQLHYDLGVAYKLKDDSVDAISELEQAENLNPAGFEPPYVLGLLYMQVGRYADAAPALETSLKLNAENGDAWATLGSVDSKLERFPEAEHALREAIRLLPDQADSHLILASVLVKQNQAAEAASERKIAASLMRDHMNLQRAEVATNSGKSLLSGGKIDDAVVEFRNAISFDPKFVEAHAGLAEALDKQGKREEAAGERATAKSLKQAAE